MSISDAFLKSKNPSSLISDSSIVWSSGNIWNNLIVESHSFDKSGFITPKNLNHKVIIKLSSTPEPHQFFLNKQKNASEKQGNICLLSTADREKFCSHQPEGLVLILADESFPPNFEIPESHNLFDAQIEFIGMALKAEAEDGFQSGRTYGESLGKALSTHLLNIYCAEKKISVERKTSLTPFDLRRVFEFIDENLHEEITLLQLAEVAGLSHYRFAHNFKDAVGVSPHRFLVLERLSRAKKMLRETDKTITEIAYAVGFGSPSRFAFTFRNETGKTPTAYRSIFE